MQLWHLASGAAHDCARILGLAVVESSAGPAGIWLARFTLRLLFSQRTHGVLGNVASDQLTERVPAHTRCSEVNATEYSCIGDLGHRRREAGKCPRTRTNVGGNGEWRVVTECGTQDKRCCAAYGRMAGGILWMRWRTRWEEIQPWDPGWVRGGTVVPICVSQTYGRDGTPENVPVLRVPARYRGVCHADVQQSE